MFSLPEYEAVFMILSSPVCILAVFLKSACYEA